MATAEEQAIAAINAAERMAIANVELIRQMKQILPKPFGVLLEPAIQTNQMGIQTVAKVERAAVRKTSRAMRASRKKLSRALKQANSKLRNKNGSLKKGKTQADVMRLAQRLRKKMK